MSDFFNSGWSLYVAGVTIVGLIFCIVLLLIAARRRVMADDNSTGHIWDEDLKEMNNPLPRWWMGLFVITVAFAVIYLSLYPGLGSNEGALKWSATGQWRAEQEKARAAMAPVYAEFVSLSAEEMGKNPKAMAIGERLFVNNCAQCHGADGRGSKSFPNLADTDWLGGTGPDYIHKTIIEGRQGMMPPMGSSSGHRGRRAQCGQLCAEPVRQPAQLGGSPVGQAEVCRLRGLPRRRWQGQPGAGCTEPDRQDLAARLGRGGDRVHDQQWQDQRHAGPGCSFHAGASQGADRLRDEFVPAHNRRCQVS